ncbi:MAG: hypothetical protein EOO85_09690 [Pedobacter sp.]|nr:MAG: hypothetical protein EOO85_09690 [Pedobacter sp.]
MKNSTVFTAGKVQATRDGYAVQFEVDGHKFTYFFDSSYILLGDSYQIGSKSQTNIYSNNRTIENIKMPFRTISSSGKDKVTINYQNILINKPLATDWKVPL